MSAVSFTKITLGFGIGLTVLALIFETAAIPAHASSYDVCPEGCRYSSVQAAVDAAAAGGIVTVGPGTYEESVTVAKSLMLRGAGTAAITGKKAAGGVRYPAVLVRAGKVNVEGLTLGPAVKGDGYTVGAEVDGADDAVFTDVTFRNSSIGAYVHDGNGARLDGCIFADDYTGINAARTAGLRVGQSAGVRFAAMAFAAFEITDGTDADVRNLTVTAVPHVAVVTNSSDVRFVRPAGAAGPDDFIVRNVSGWQVSEPAVAATSVADGTPVAPEERSAADDPAAVTHPAVSALPPILPATSGVIPIGYGVLLIAAAVIAGFTGRRVIG